MGHEQPPIIFKKFFLLFFYVFGSNVPACMSYLNQNFWEKQQQNWSRQNSYKNLKLKSNFGIPHFVNAGSVKHTDKILLSIETIGCF